MPAELIAKIVEATDIQEVWDIQCEAMATFGFDRLIYGYTRFAPGGSLGQIEDAVILTRHDTDYVNLFIGEKMYLKGPMIRWAAEHTGACSWSYIHGLIARNELTADEMEMMAINLRMEVVAGYTMSFNDTSTRAKGALGLTAERGMIQSDVDDICKSKGGEIELMAEVLQWIADGKTIQDKSVIMGLNPATIENTCALPVTP